MARKTLVSYRMLGIVVIAAALLGVLFFKCYYQPMQVDRSAASGEATQPTPTPDPRYVTTVPAVPSNESLRQFTVKNRFEADRTTYQNYIIEYPASWNLRMVQQIYGTDLLLTKDDYALNLSQSGSIVGDCEFDGELLNGVYATESIPKEYTQIRAGDHLYRRVTNPDKMPDKTFMYYCEHMDGYYDYPPLATITYTAPKEYDPSVIEAMDNMIRSIQTIER